MEGPLYVVSCIWCGLIQYRKPRDTTVTASDAGRSVLRRSLDAFENDLSRFCDDMTEDSTCRMYLPDARSRSQKHPVYVVVVPTPPAPAAAPQPPDRDDGEDDTLEAMLSSAWCAFDLPDSYPQMSIAFNRRNRLPASSMPSTSALPVNYAQAQQDEGRYIVDGRYAKACPLRAALPVELFHPVFAQFVTGMADEQLQVPEDVVKDTAKLMLHLSQIAVKEKQREDTCDDLSDILDCDITQTVDRNRTCSDHIIIYNRPSHPKDQIALAIIEEKAELGSGGSDPSVQGSFSYEAHWRDTAREVHYFCHLAHRHILMGSLPYAETP